MAVRSGNPATDEEEIAEDRSRSGGFRPSGLGLALLAVAFVAETAAFVWLGRSVIDEGVFYNAGRMVAEGMVLYRDFPWSQGPTLPYLLAVISALFGSSLLAGRVLAWVGCLTSVGASSWIAFRLAGRGAALLAMLLAMTNVPMLWVSTTIRSQAFSTPLVMLAAAALVRTPKSALGWAAAPSLLLWATGIRLTDGLVLATVCAWTAWQLRARPGELARVAAWVGGQALFVLLPVLRAPGEAWFHVATSQLGRAARAGEPPMALVEKLGFYLNPFYGFHLPVLFAAAVGVALLVAHVRGSRTGRGLPGTDPASAKAMLLALAALVFAPHLALSHVFLTYAVTASLLVTTAAAIALGTWARDRTRAPTGDTEGRRWAPVLAIALTLLAASANAAQRWGTFVGRGESGLAHLRAVGSTLRGLGGRDCTIATLQTHLGVESGCRLFPGLEYSGFSFFRELDDAEARTLGVLNPSLLDRHVASRPPELIAVSRHDSMALRARGQKPVGGIPILDFIPSSAFDYAFYEAVQIPSGLRLPEAPDALRVEVFVHRDRVRWEKGGR